MGSSFCQSRGNSKRNKNSRDCQQVNHITTSLLDTCFSAICFNQWQLKSCQVLPSIGSKSAVTWKRGKNRCWSLPRHSLFVPMEMVNFIQISGNTIVSEMSVTNHIIIINTTPHTFGFFNSLPFILSSNSRRTHLSQPPTITNHHFTAYL